MLLLATSENLLKFFATRHTFEARYTKIKVFDHFRKLWWSFTDLKKGLEKNFEKTLTHRFRRSNSKLELTKGYTNDLGTKLVIISSQSR